MVVNHQTINQVIEINALCSESASVEDNLNLVSLCPVRALRTYGTHVRTPSYSSVMEETNGVTQFSKHRLSHWVVDTISQAYDSQGLPAPGNLVAHSTRSMATSWAALRGVSVAHFYRVNVAAATPLSTAVLSAARGT
ncbi:hypothetical protein N1851_018268 [Merluccius polli]|uniref:Uncharacterized protein n=1 Tax=Merluccius polli TaxID=89951 RepID=A0AA47MNF9_MERPO|nr:hypothetical protein N1851_018268 [Merluccius polli]